MMKILPALLLAAALAACSNDRPALERQLFMIQTERPGAAAQPVAESLRIGRVAMASPFDERALVYRRDDVRYETDIYNQFASDPADMLADGIAGWLRQSGLFRRIVPPGAAGGADYRLETGVSSFYVDFQAEPPAAVLDIRWRLTKEGESGNVLELDCRERVDLKERSPAGAVRAQRQALEQALGKLETALGSARL